MRGLPGFAALTLLAATTGWAQPAPPLDEVADAYWQAGLYRDALKAADAAVQQSPSSRLGLLTRARARQAVALTTLAIAALEKPTLRFDYDALAGELVAAERDAAAVSPVDAEVTALRGELATVLARLRTARVEADQLRASAEARERALREEAPEQGRQLAVEAAAEEAAARLKAVRDYDLDWGSTISKRTTGFVLGAAGLVLGGVMLGTLLRAEDDVASVRRGGLPTSSAIQSRLTEAGALRTIALPSGIVGGVVLIIGSILVLTSTSPPDRPSLTFGLWVDPTGASVGLGVTLP